MPARSCARSSPARTGAGATRTRRTSDATLAAPRRRPIATSMSRPLLVGYDARTADRAPVDFGVAAARLTGAPLLIACVHVGPRPLAVSAGQPLSYAIAPAEDSLVSDCSDILRRLGEELEPEGVSADYLKLPGDSAARVLNEAA